MCMSATYPQQLIGALCCAAAPLLPGTIKLKIIVATAMRMLISLATILAGIYPSESLACMCRQEVSIIGSSWTPAGLLSSAISALALGGPIGDSQKQANEAGTVEILLIIIQLKF